MTQNSPTPQGLSPADRLIAQVYAKAKKKRK